MSMFLLLFFEFFKTGLFAIGGGLATLPFLSEMSEKYPWFSESILSEMVAISESTPGPLGVNMATYAGFSCGYNETGNIFLGIFGAIIATTALVLPSLIIVIALANFLDRFKKNKIVNGTFEILRPTVTALIAVACVDLLQIALFNITSFSGDIDLISALNIPTIILFLIMLIASNVWKKLHPIVFIAFAAICGIIFQL